MLGQSRYAKWVNASHGLDHILLDAATVIQGLGKLDAKLVREDEVFRGLTVEARGSFEESLKLTERFTLSYLWVLGTYEVVRAAWARVDKNSNLLPKSLAKRLTTAKREFARLRMPLAKFEAASSHRTDFPVGRPAMHRELGISWRIASRTFISRRKLSDRWLTLLEALEKRRERGLSHLTPRSSGTRAGRREQLKGSG